MEQNNSFQSELNNIISSEDERRQKERNYARFNAERDFESLKKQIKFIVSEKAYKTNPDGTHTVYVMYPQYPNTIQYCGASQYLDFKEDSYQTFVKTGIFSTSKVTRHSLYCRVNDDELYNIYKKHLEELCKKDNIECTIVATEMSDRSSILGLSNTYKKVPGCLESGKVMVFLNSHHIRLYATMNF